MTAQGSGNDVPDRLGNLDFSRKDDFYVLGRLVNELPHLAGDGLSFRFDLGYQRVAQPPVPAIGEREVYERTHFHQLEFKCVVHAPESDLLVRSAAIKRV
ncbi:MULTISPECIES: hypothetical protein [unclassified Streptomyces]|uniref:hypothetical protein n=1 Tax=unclassified Streptomyces TaxID=2593676 RepID=UPI002E167D4C|nr:hypothetical protein OG457_11425 [Streptomyces sp. NBC_01207]WTA17662.1 hypothetical protein OG365_06120 [Streptomyces sp. NBC_00853]